MLIHIAKQVYKFTNYEEAVCKVKQALEKADEQLTRLKIDYIDVYLLHNLGFENWEKVIKYDDLAFLDKTVQKVKIRHKGFSYHGPVDLFKEVVDAYDWEMAQIQLNVLDEFHQVGVEGLKCAAAKNLAIAIMEPLKGGSIVLQAFDH
jgi:predicted aldo/keto reductase-like oxidoreductase